MGNTGARKDDQVMDQQIEFVEDDLKDIKKNDNVMGTVKLTEDSIVYIPTPTTDPQGMKRLSSVYHDSANICRSVEHGLVAKMGYTGRRLHL